MDIVASELNGKCRVVKFESEQEPGGLELASRLSVSALPTLLFVVDGEMVHHVEGAFEADQIVSWANAVFFESGEEASRRGAVRSAWRWGRKRSEGVASVLASLPFVEARAMAISMGMGSYEEWE
eukprot:4508508-Prymnesium_polylepis.1